MYSHISVVSNKKQNTETIISSFPQRWEEEASQEPKVLETIQAHLTEKNRPQVKSVYEMAAMITSYCIRFADKCSIKGIAANGKEFEESFLQVYASSVSNEVNAISRHLCEITWLTTKKG